jgi:hypothetical protein
MKKSFLAILLLVTLSGCAPSYIRYFNSNGASQDQFMKDRYACYQETQQRISSAYINQYGGAASSQIMPSCSAINACLAARGYYRSDTTKAADLNAPGSLIVPQGAVIQCQDN